MSVVEGSFRASRHFTLAANSWYVFSTRQFGPILLALALVMTVVLGSVVAQQQSATVDATPSGPNEGESTHAITFSVGDSAVAGVAWEDILLDYSVDAPSADVSNVGADSIERVGIDRDDDDPGSQVDVRAETISEVSGQADGNALRITLGGTLTLQQGDEIVVVITPVQNPQNAGTADVELTVNTQGEAVARTGTVTYEQHDATTTFADQTSAGETVVVDRVNLSEGGFVAVQNTSGATPGEIRGTSTYLEPGVHEDVEVTLDTPIESTQDLVAQAYTDSNADRDFDYASSGGEVDGPYRNTDDNVIGSDTATVTHDPDATQTATETETQTESATETTTDATTVTATETQTDSTSGDDGSGSDTTTTSTETVTETQAATDSESSETVGDDEDTAATDETMTTDDDGTAAGGGISSALLAALLVALLFAGSAYFGSAE